MRIVFMGSGEFGLPTLEGLCKAHEVALVVTQPDRPAGRHRHLTPTPIASWAQAAGLAVIKPQRVNAPEILSRIVAAQADANIVVAFGQKIGDAVIASPRLGRIATMNLHASLLPRYRGAAPIHWAILRGESKTGNTVFSLVDRMDAGDILGMHATPIGRRETAGELHDRLAAMGPGLVLQVLDDLRAGRLTPIPQDDSQATVAPKLTRQDARIDWTVAADVIRCRVHGMYPWPGVSVRYRRPDGQEGELKLCRVDSVSGQGPPGALIGQDLVAAGTGAIQLLEVQPPGKRLMNWQEFQRGHGLPAGTSFLSSPATG